MLIRRLAFTTTKAHAICRDAFFCNLAKFFKAAIS